LLGSQRKASIVTSDISDNELSSIEHSKKEDTPITLTEIKPQQGKESQRITSLPVLSSTYPEPSMQERKKGVLILTIVGVIGCSISLGPMVVLIASAIAGAISGLNRIRIVAAFVGWNVV